MGTSIIKLEMASRIRMIKGELEKEICSKIIDKNNNATPFQILKIHQQLLINTYHILFS
jgi:hypothetical protein